MPSRLHHERLLMGSPLRRAQVSRAVCAALGALLVFAAFIHLGMLLGMPGRVAMVYIGALALSGVLSLMPVSALWYLDRRERETPSLTAAALLWGGCIATAIAVPFNGAAFLLVDRWLVHYPDLASSLGPDAALMLSAPISAPVVEEIAKAAGLLLLFWLLRAEFDNMRDGIVYGALIGVGFNWCEAALYVASDYAEFGVATFATQLGARYALFGLGGHAMFTAVFGASLGLAIQTRRRWLRVAAPVAGLLVAMAAHALNNALPLFLTLAGAAAGEPPPARELPEDVSFATAFVAASVLQLVIFLPVLILLALALWRSGLWERRVIREELAGEVGRAVTGEEYEEIARDRMLRTRRVHGPDPHVAAALVNAQHELAFRKRRVREEGGDPERDRLVAGWLADIARLRAAT